LAAGSGGYADSQVLRAVASTIDESDHQAALLAAGRIRILLLSDALVAGPGESASGAGADRLVRLAERTGALIGAPLLERAADQAAPRLALTLVGPGQSELVHVHAATPVVPVAGVTFARAAFREPLNIVNVDGFAVGIAAIGDADVAISRLSDRGADLVLLTGGPVSRAQIARFADAARAGRVALLVAGRCAGTPDCVASAAVDADGKVDWTGGSSHVFVRRPRWSPPSALGLPESVPQPARFDYAPALAELGRALFFDKAISDTGSIACASCHDPTLGFSDGRARGVGVRGRQTRRKVVSLLNVAFRPVLRWDGYASSLENFVKYPISGHDEMDSHRLDRVRDRIGRSPAYRARFAALFGRDRISFERVELALAAYMRTLIAGNSPFDQAVVEGRRDAMTQSAWRGYGLFAGRAGCAGCHAYSTDSPFFTDFQTHNTGLGWDKAASRYRDPGAGAIGSAALAGSFRTPTLRDVARTGPYMHDGSLATLRDVIDHFDRGGGDGPGRDPGLRPLHLTEQDKKDLEAFLVALTGTTRFDSAGRRIDRQLARQ
jgi:cytochrome c peroxidase